jgi:hypothetical protein
MSIDDLMIMVAAGLGIAVVAALFWQTARRRSLAASGEASGARAQRTEIRSDAYFKAMFPELQPHFHPEKVVRIVRDRNGRANVADGRRWQYPAGFDVAAAQVAIAGGREHIRLLDAAGALLAEFDYEQQPAGGALRMGRGKLTAVLDVQNNPRVRYWHPEREFKWSKKGGWQFTTPVAERSFDSSDDGSRFSASGTSSSSTLGTAAAAAGTAALVSGAGGAFAGGGASESWESSDSAAPDGAAGSTAY